ncbi:MAG: hypothetical protein K2K81_07185 [Muribaculaceae bacterium]|nr:hypothetical protein [Muribaculaceae bacterium]
MRLLMIIAIMTLASCKGKLSPDDLSEVYVCTSEGAKAYHAKDDCMGIANCSEEIRKVKIEEAKGVRKPCSMCIKKDKSSNESEGSTIGKYVYKDPYYNGKVHVDRSCPYIHESAERILSSEAKYDNGSYCLHCVSDENYDKLMNLK